MVKNLPAMQELQAQSLVKSRRSPGAGNGNSLQYSCLGNLMDRDVCWATDHGVEKSQT